jgi:uncharacterized membrane protein HdeD (DUF308 family)
MLTNIDSHLQGDSFFIAVWSIFTGVLEIVTAIQLRKSIENEWMLWLAGLLSLLYGVALISFPDAGALALVWKIGGYALIFGILLLALAWRLRGVGERITCGAMHPA